VKVAYIFFGQVKNFSSKQYDSIKNNILEQCKEFELDFYLCTSRNEKYFSQRQSKSEGESFIDFHSIEKYFDFKYIFYDELDNIDLSEINELAGCLVDNFGKAWGEHSLPSTINSLKQIYSLEYFYSQFSKIDLNYDAFILSRTDLFHTHKISVDSFYADYDIAVPYYNDYPQIDYGWFGGINDRFAIIKNRKALNTYCSRYSRIKERPEYYHAEKYLLSQIEKDELLCDKINNFEFRLIRANGNITDLIGIYPDKSMNELNNISKSFFINLDRRKDRLEHIRSNLPFPSNRFSAVDSKDLDLSNEVLMLYPNDYHVRSKSEICCAMSHYKLWKKLSLDDSAQNYLILEDDVVFKDGFVKFWNNAFSKKLPEDFDLIYIGGCQPWNKPLYHKVLQRYNDYFCTVKKNDYFTKDDHFWQMNTQSYIISKKAAINICRWIELNGISNALDHFMINFFNENTSLEENKKIYHLNPLMTYQLHEEGDSTEIDKNSDIRNDSNKFKKINLTKIIHQSWKDDDIPYDIYPRDWIDSWKKLNPDWEYKFWTDEDNRNLILSDYPQYLELYDSYERPIAKADIVRLFYMHKFGGLYVDLDFKCLKCFDDLIIPEVINLGRQQTKNFETNSIANALIYSPPGQDFWLQCADELIHHKFIDGKLNNTEAATGPIFLYNCLNKFKPNLKIHDPELCYPVSWELDGSAISNSLKNEWLKFPEKSFPDAYSITYWSGGWRRKINKKSKPKINFIWQNPGGFENCFERDWLMELFEDFEINNINDGEFMNLKSNSVVVYSDILSEDLSIYGEDFARNQSKLKERKRQYFEKFRDRNSFLIHLSDEHRHASIHHYKYFKHVFRQYYRSDADLDNVTFIPLGYKKGFNNE